MLGHDHDRYDPAMHREGGVVGLGRGRHDGLPAGGEDGANPWVLLLSPCHGLEGRGGGWLVSWQVACI